MKDEGKRLRRAQETQGTAVGAIKSGRLSEKLVRVPEKGINEQ